ncbi:Uncharacterised protein [Bordetella pertussis]|nr:Uncharacterised protein [Bordetella pertussis]CFP66904.1 Uncharacterised protein [Bordetella pertussis]
MVEADGLRALARESPSVTRATRGTPLPGPRRRVYADEIHAISGNHACLSFRRMNEPYLLAGRMATGRQPLA